MGSKKSKKQTQQVADYHMSIHMGVSLGVVDAVNRIYIGEKEIYSGGVISSTALSISLPELFGGPKKEGGVSGTLNLLFGEDTQVLPSGLASKLGGTPATVPGFRGYLSAWFHSGKGKKGFYWGTNSPYIKPTWFNVFRKSKNLNALYRTIPCTVYVPADGDTAESSYVVQDSNPVNMLYECLTDTEWGMGGATTSIDTQSFLDAQLTLFNENFGLSMQWVNSTAIEAFSSEILDHIEGTMFVHPYTGLLTLKLIRADYDETDIPNMFVINAGSVDDSEDQDNAIVENFQRKMWGETINEIVVTWTNPVNEQEETVTVQDLANIAMQGGTVSDSRNYYGVRNNALAVRLANRDLRVASAPLVTLEATVNRNGWALVPGDVCVLNYPEENIALMIVRILKIDYGKIGDSSIKVALIEDVFSLVQAQYVEAPRSQWTDPTSAPVDVANYKIITAPYLLVEAELGTTETEALEYPEVIGAILVAQPNEDTYNFSLLAERLDGTGSPVFQTAGDFNLVPMAALSAAMIWESPSSSMTVTSFAATNEPGPGWLALIGNAATPEDQCELVYIAAGSGTAFTVQRGILDTIPRDWPLGTQVWFFQSGMSLTEAEIHSASETINYKFLPRTSAGTLPASSATVHAFTYSDRSWGPVRPANVLVDGVSHGSVDHAEPVSPITVSWANRNRLAEPVPPLSWNSGTVTGEIGQTTTIRLSDPSTGAVIIEHAGLTGTTFDIPAASFAFYPYIKVTVLSERDGYESFQSQSVTFNFPDRIGYGRSWGYNYGSP